MHKWSVVAQVCDPSTRRIEAGRAISCLKSLRPGWELQDPKEVLNQETVSALNPAFQRLRQ